MVSLPNIFQEGSQHFPGRELSNSSKSSNSINLSSIFCNACTEDLALPVNKINPQILQEYEEKCAQIRNMQRLLYQEHSSCDNDDISFQISNASKESLQIYAFGFPLVQQSKLLPPKTDELDWNHLQEKILRRQSRCQILHRTPYIGKEDTVGQLRFTKKKVRILPTLIPNKYGFETGGSTESLKPRPQKMLQAEPQVIVFNNFEVGGYYKKICKITNISRGKCTFQIQPMDNHSQFRIVWNSLINTLAAGLSFIVTVEFFCRSVADIEEALIITSKNGEDLVVLIQAISPPPHLIEVSDSSCNVEEVVDSFVDCGSHFVGDKTTFTLTLKNVGHSARFCFITEMDWMSREFNIDSSNMLFADPFTIEPMYFSLRKEQEIVISISASPPASGMHTTRVLLLCDNGTLNQIDFVCDGILFDPSLLQFLEMSKTFDVDIQDVEIADCYFDFGPVLTCDSMFFCFFLFNIGSINLSYHWELRATLVPGTKSLPPWALSIMPMRGRLNAQFMEMICLRVETFSIDPGVYRSLLVLVVDNLPKKCIPLNLSENLLPSNEEEEEEVYSIEAKHIELWMECVLPTISLVPYVVDFSDFPLICGSPVETREIIVKNESPGAVSLMWKCFVDSTLVKVEITPTHLQCNKFSANICTLSVEAVQEGSFGVIFWCISEKGDVKVQLLVKGSCCKSTLTTFTDSIDFGLIKRGEPQSAALVAKNCSSSDCFQWELKELEFTAADNELVDIPEGLSFLSTNEGEFCHKDSEVLVNYQLNTQEDMLWCSVLEWDSQFIPVIADFQMPDVGLSTYTIVADQLNLEVCKKFSVTVSNHSFLSTAVFWGTPMGMLSDEITVEVSPIGAILEPAKEVVTEISITPHLIGPLKDLYIPCFVENQLQPLLLRVEGNVEGLKVRVEWDSGEKHCCVHWPPLKSMISEDIIEGPSSSESIVCICPPISQKLSEECLNTNCDIISLDSNFSLSLKLDQNESTEFPKEDASDVNEEDDNVSQVSSVPYLNWPIIGGRYTRGPTSEEWENHFNNLFLLEEYSRDIDETEPIDNSFDIDALCFHDIPLRKAVTQHIYIRNDTMISSFYEASVVYNFERIQEPDKTPDPEKILKKIRADENDDQWLERASQARGLTVFVEPASGQLLPEDYVILSVTVVALSWGQYSDTIIVQMGDLEHVCIKLSVTVSQPPVSIQQLVRFGGGLSLKSPPQSRCLKVQNSSTVPVYVCWQIFTPSNLDAYPFSLMLFDRDPFELKFTPFYGLQSSPIFQIMDKYTFLEPNSSKEVEVKFHPHLIDLNVAEKVLSESLRVILMGHIYLTDEARNKMDAESCIRVDGPNLAPVQVDLEAHVELPILSLLNVFNYQLVFKCSAYDVMSTEEKIWRTEKVITLKNKCHTDLKSRVYTVGYFNVTKIDYPCALEQNRFYKDFIFLQPGETCEVTISCEVTEETLLDCFEEEPEVLSDSTIQLGTVEHGVICFEQEDLKQEVKLELWLYQPLLHISEASLNFGLVYIEDTKILTVTITAPAGKESFDAFLKSGENRPFSINVNSGVLKPKEGFLLQVSFSPKAYTTYKDTLIVRSCLKKMFCAIPLTGIGTFNYKTHVY